MPTPSTPPAPPSSTPPPPPPRRTAPPVPKPDPLKASIETIRKNAAQLNALTDNANRTVQKVEEFLNEQCSIGIAAFVSFRLFGDDGGGMYLEYRRVGPRYRIAVVETDSNGQDADVKAWSDAPREHKLESFAKLPELLVRVGEKVQELIRSTEESIKAVDENLSALTGG